MKRIPLSFFVVLGAMMAHVAMVIFGAQGLRGSDQYWYAADLAMSQLTGMPASNSIYPLVWSAPELWSPDVLPPPIHNTPVVYIASLFNGLFADEYATWVTLNTILAVASSLVLFWLARRITSSMVAAFVVALFLLSPQTTWFSLNALSEQFIVFLALVIVAGSALIARRPWTGLALMAIASVVLIASRENFILLLPLELVFLIVLLRKRVLRWPAAVAYAVAVALSLTSIRMALTPYPSSGWKGALTIGIPPEFGVMSAFFSADPKVSLGHIVGKMGRNLLAAVVPSNPQDVILETATILMLLGGILLIDKTVRAQLLVFWGISFFAIYIATCAIFQAQSRYLGAVFPLALLLAIVALSQLARRRKVARTWSWMVASGLVALSLVLSSIVALEYRTSALADEATTATMREQLATGEAGSILSLNLPLGSTVELGFAVLPALVLVDVPSDFQPCLTETLATHWDVRRIVAPLGTTVDDVRSVFCGVILPEESVRNDGTVTSIKGPYQVFTLTVPRP